MSKYDYDYIVIGAGVTGLMTSVRLAENGAKVILFEQGKVGSGASIGNQGIIHSGGMYAELHPEVVGTCKETAKLFTRYFSNAIIPSRKSLFFADKKRIEEIRIIWEEQNLKFDDSSLDEIQEFMRSQIAKRFFGLSIYEPTVSPKQILINLAQLCLDLGVHIHTMTSVHEIVHNNNKFVGVKVGRNELVLARGGVLCSGIENKKFMENMQLKSATRIKSRLATMIAIKNNTLNRALISLNYGGLTLVPTVSDYVLGSLYGGQQPEILSNRVWSVNYKNFNDIVIQVNKLIRPSVINLNKIYAYSHAKTEVSSGSADFAGVEPSYYVFGHKLLDNLDNFWSIIPGKMSFVFHATAVVVSQILSTKQSISIKNKMPKITEQAVKLVHSEPWEINN